MILPFLPSHCVSEVEDESAGSCPRPFVILECRSEWGLTIERAELHAVTGTGAVVRLMTPKPLAEDVSVYFPDDGLQRKGVVQWSNGRLFGVKLDGSTALPERWRRDNQDASRFVVIEGGQKPECRIDF